MENRNLDVWAVQYEPQELEMALSNLKVKGNTILFTNALCRFKLGDVEIKSRQFDTFLYSEENDLLVMFMWGGKVTTKDIKKYLDSNNLYYNEVVLAPSIIEYEDGYKIPSLWIAREEYVVEDALKESIKNGRKLECQYYPNLIGSLDLSYLTNSSDSVSIDGRSFKGLMQLEDKIILLVSQNDKRNMNVKSTCELLEKLGFQYTLLEGQPQLIEEEKGRRR